VTKPTAFGGIVINKEGRVLLREPKDHKGGYFGTFPKTRAEVRETPEEAALRAVRQKGGVEAEIRTALAGTHPGETTDNVYFLMSPLAQSDEHESGVAGIVWVDRYEAKGLIGKTLSEIGQKRDLEVLQLAFELFDHLQSVERMDLWDYYRIEKEVLSCAALRFDGYKYEQETGFDWDKACEVFFQTGELPKSKMEQMALFYMLQRFLFKWGGEMLSHEDPHWKLFRTLFLSVCTAYAPPYYRVTFTDAYDRWPRDFFPRLKEYKAIVDLIHRNTHYHAPDEGGPQ